MQIEDPGRVRAIGSGLRWSPRTQALRLRIAQTAEQCAAVPNSGAIDGKLCVASRLCPGKAVARQVSNRQSRLGIVSGKIAATVHSVIGDDKVPIGGGQLTVGQS